MQISTPSTPVYRKNPVMHHKASRRDPVKKGDCQSEYFRSTPNDGVITDEGRDSCWGVRERNTKPDDAESSMLLERIHKATFVHHKVLPHSRFGSMGFLSDQHRIAACVVRSRWRTFESIP